MSETTVKIARFHQTGGPEVIKLDSLPLPEPKAGEVRLRVQAIGLNRAEVMFRKGKYLIEPKLPAKLGYEAAGIVEAIGPGVDKKMLHRKYSTVPCFDLNEYGVYGEVAIVPAYALAAYPENLTPIEACSIWMQYITAYGALVQISQIGKDDTVVITAASSSVGIAAIEIAKVQGATSIAVTRTAHKKAELLALGANHVIVTDEEDLAKRVKEITNNKGATVLFDPIGGEGVMQLAEAAAYGATIFLYGALSPNPTPFPLFLGMTKELTVRGYTLFAVLAQPALREQAEKYVYKHLESGALKPKIDKIFPLSEIVEAHRYMESNSQIGKIIVQV